MVNSMFGGDLDPYEKSLSYEYPYHPSGNPKHIDVSEIDNLTLELNNLIKYILNYIIALQIAF